MVLSLPLPSLPLPVPVKQNPGGKKFCRTTIFTVMFHNFAEIQALTLHFMLNGSKWNYADINMVSFKFKN